MQLKNVIPTRRKLLPLACLLAALPFTAAAQTDGTWNTNTGNWSTAANWVSSTIGGGAKSVVRLDRNISANTIITVDDSTDRTVGLLYMGDTNTTHWMRVDGAGATNPDVVDGGRLIFDNGTDPAQLNFISTAAGGSGSDPGLRLETRLDSNLEINNESPNGQHVTRLAANSPGIKTVTNVSTGTGTVNLGRSGATGQGTASALTDGAGILAVRQNSPTSTLFMGSDNGGTTNTFTGGFIWDAGNVGISGATPFGHSSGPVQFNAAGTLTNTQPSAINNSSVSLNADIAIISSAAITSRITFNGILTMTADRVLHITTNADPTGSYISFGGTLTDGGNGYSFTKDGPGRLQLDGAFTGSYTGGTFVDGGSLIFNKAGPLPSNGALTVRNGAIVNMQSVSQTITDLNLVSGQVDGTGSSLVAAAYNVESGSISKPIAGTNAPLTKTTTGTVTISGAASYTGATAVNAGTLIISGTFSNDSTITVAAGAELRYNSATARTGSLTLNGDGATRAILGGTGSINLALTLDNIGDTLSPGNSPGILPFGTSQTWSSFTYLWEVNDFTGTTAGTNFDQIQITGSLNLTGGPGSYAIDITSLTAGNTPGNVPNFSETETSWTILTTTTGITGFNPANWSFLTGNFSSSPAPGGSWSLEQINNNLVLTYVPEPSSWLLLGLGLSAILLRRRATRQS